MDRSNARNVFKSIVRVNKMETSKTSRHRSKSKDVDKDPDSLADDTTVGSSSLGDCPLPPSCPHRYIPRGRKICRKKSPKKTKLKTPSSSIPMRKKKCCVETKTYERRASRDHVSPPTRDLVERIGRCKIYDSCAQTKHVQFKKPAGPGEKSHCRKKSIARVKVSDCNSHSASSHHELSYSVSYDTVGKKMSENEKLYLSSTDDSSSSESSDWSGKDRANQCLGAKNNLVRNIEAVKVENKPHKGKKHGKSRKSRTKIVRGPPRVCNALTPAKKEKVVREQARVAVEELCRQASCAIISQTTHKNPKLSSPAMSPCSMIKDFKEKVDKGKGKRDITPSKISIVAYPPAGGAKDCQALQPMPRTYQQLGLSPLQRSPSSKNFFPNMAPFLRGDEGNIPPVKSPPKVWDSRLSRQNNNSSQRLSSVRDESVSTGDEDLHKSPSRRASPRNSKSCVHPRKLISFKQASQSFHSKGMVLQQTILPLFSKRIDYR